MKRKTTLISKTGQWSKKWSEKRLYIYLPRTENLGKKQNWTLCPADL
jgi:hypothetical protein